MVACTALMVLPSNSQLEEVSLFPWKRWHVPPSLLITWLSLNVFLGFGGTTAYNRGVLAGRKSLKVAPLQSRKFFPREAKDPAHSAIKNRPKSRFPEALIKFAPNLWTHDFLLAQPPHPVLFHSPPSQCSPRPPDTAWSCTVPFPPAPGPSHQVRESLCLQLLHR